MSCTSRKGRRQNVPAFRAEILRKKTNGRLIRQHRTITTSANMANLIRRGTSMRENCHLDLAHQLFRRRGSLREIIHLGDFKIKIKVHKVLLMTP